jgi:hypothetical protein
LGWILLSMRRPSRFWIRLQPAAGALTVHFLSDPPCESARWFQTAVQDLAARLELRAVETANKDQSARSDGNATARR